MIYDNALHSHIYHAMNAADEKHPIYMVRINSHSIAFAGFTYVTSTADKKSVTYSANLHAPQCVSWIHVGYGIMLYNNITKIRL